MLPNEQRPESSKRLQSTAIPFELLLSIFEFLDLNSLANVAQTNRFNREAAGTVFKSQFLKSGFTLNGQTILYDRYSNNPNQFDELLNIIAAFGHLITKLSLDYYTFDEEQKVAINRQVTKYAAHSLIEIDLKNCQEKDVFGLTGPFTRAKVVRLRDGFIGAMLHINFSELFPLVSSLDIESMLFVAEACVKQHFPYLKEFKMESATIALSTIEERLQLNPQLRKLSVTGSNLDTLSMISKNAPKLEHLLFRGFYGRDKYQGDEIHFQSLKSFDLTSKVDFPVHFDAIPIVFDELEEFSCDGSYDKWTDVIVRCKFLKKITFHQFFYENLQRIVLELPSVEEILVKNQRIWHDDVDTAIKIIEMCKQLKRFTISLGDFDDCRARAVNLNNWEIIAVNRSVVFVRKD